MRDAMKNFPAALKQFCRRNPALTGSVIFCLIPVLVWVAFDAYSRIRLASAIQRIEREGISCRLPDFRERYAPSPEAVLAEFTRLGEAMQTAESKYSPSGTLELDPAALAAGEAELLNQADAFLDRNPRIGFARIFEGEAAFRQQLPELLCCLAWTRINAGRIRLLRKEGQMEEAARLFDLTARLRDNLLEDFSFNSWFLAMRIENILLDILYNSAAEGTVADFSPELLKRWEVASAETEERFRRRLLPAFEYELTFFTEIGMNPDLIRESVPDTSLRQKVIRWCWPLFRPVVRLDAAYGLEVYRRIYPRVTAEKEIAKNRAELQDIATKLIDDRKNRWHPVISQLKCSWGEIFLGVQLMYARQRTLRAGLAAERFLRDHGHPPATLEELVPEYLPEVPRNPFTGDPLKLESGRLVRLLPDGTSETFNGFRVYDGGDPAAATFGSTRTNHRGDLPVWNRREEKAK